MCGLGRLYSKQALIECLLDKDNRPEAIGHIRSLKDVKELKLTPNPAYGAEESKLGGRVPFICKLIGLEMSGKFRFIGLWSCGCVMSERALKEIAGASTTGTSNSSVGGNCPICQKSFGVEDIVILNPSEDELELQQCKIDMRLNKRKAQKKQKNDKKAIIKTETNDIPSSSSAVTNIKKNSTSTTENNSSLQQEVVPKTEEVQQSKATKRVANPKRLGAVKACLEDPDIKRLKTDYSVAKDPNASDVYKSLFTTHDSDKKQNRAHWITYNPFYN